MQVSFAVPGEYTNALEQGHGPIHRRVGALICSDYSDCADFPARSTEQKADPTLAKHIETHIAEPAFGQLWI